GVSMERHRSGWLAKANAGAHDTGSRTRIDGREPSVQETATRARSNGQATSRAEYGSDLIVELIRSLGIPFVALNPGSSYRAIHDSFVNFAGGCPEMVLCCHDEIAVAVARGYARARGSPWVAATHVCAVLAP